MGSKNFVAYGGRNGGNRRKVSPKSILFGCVLMITLLWWHNYTSESFVMSNSGNDDSDAVLINSVNDEDVIDVQVDLEEESGSVSEDEEDGGADLPVESFDGMDLEKLRSLERELNFWGKESDSQRKVFFWGSEFFFSMQFRIWKEAFKNVNFKVVKRKNFGRLPKSEFESLQTYDAIFCLSYEVTGCLPSLKYHQQLDRSMRFNHALYLRDILWNKGSFCQTIRSATQDNPFFNDYVFQCWIYPKNFDDAIAYAADHPNQHFIIKPLASGGGKGIHVIDQLKSADDLGGAVNKAYIIQNFLHNPHLINQYKWDIRAYCVMTSSVPMRAYLFGRGIVRFASQKFDKNAKKGGDRSQFLTNTSLGTKWKKSNVTSITWSFDDLKEHFEKQGVSYTQVMNNILGATSVVFLSAELEWRRLYETNNDSCNGCYKHFGFDIIVDDQLNARVIEANGQPGLVLTKDKSDHYSVTKATMVRDLIHMIYNGEPAADELYRALVGAELRDLKQLDTTDWQYLLEYFNERQHKGQFLQVYPNHDLNKIHSTLLEQQEIYKKKLPNRLALHRVLEHLESKK